MKLWEKIKRVMPNRKKRRVKKNPPLPSAEMTTAEMLIANNWNITFSNPEPKRKGEGLTYERLREKRKANEKIPDNRGEITRQVRRQVERREFKALRAMAREERRKNKREAQRMKTAREADLRRLVTP